MIEKLQAFGLDQFLRSFAKYLSKNVRLEDKPIKLRFFFLLRGLVNELNIIHKYHLPLKKMIRELQYDRSIPNKFSISLLFNGETEWIKIELSYFKVHQKANTIRITDIKSSRPWLETLIKLYLLDLVFCKTGVDEYSMDATLFNFLR